MRARGLRSKEGLRHPDFSSLLSYLAASQSRFFFYAVEMLNSEGFDGLH